ncbi:MAG: 4Fe-4S ferredoxin [Sphingobacteriia bacterium]|nr:4Fe-4S ferredoxin [Sphingobacteriia bacterium]
MKRKIISIDEERCNGCGLCIPNCHEGALQIIDGKARLVSDLFCDGLGACVGNCPQGAISIEEREAEPYNEVLVMKEMVKKGKNTVLAHLQHLREHGAEDLLSEAIAYIKNNKIDLDITRQEPVLNQNEIHQAIIAAKNEGCGGSCPGTIPASFVINPENRERSVDSFPEVRSELSHWPVQLHLLNPMSPFLKNSDLVLAADCAAFSMGNFHTHFLKCKTLAIACPKLDSNQDSYLQKLVAMIREARLNTITVARMEVPCCSGLTRLVELAVQQSGKNIPVKQAVISSNGKVLTEEWI